MTSNLLKIGFIGGGKMAQAMAKGFISAGIAKGETIISSCHPSDTESAKAFHDLGAESRFENFSVIKQSDVVIIAVKPSVVPEALSKVKEIRDIETDKLFLSIAMGVTIHRLEQLLPKDSHVIRVMSNTPALVLCGTSVFVTGSKTTERDVQTTQTLLQSIGSCEQVSENLLDAITALSGSGPAYIYVLIESLADGGVHMGLPRDLSYRLATQTILGAVKMVKHNKSHPGKLKDNVTSPAGSTSAGLYFLEQKGFRAAIIGAIKAATERCRQISKQDSTKDF